MIDKASIPSPLPQAVYLTVERGQQFPVELTSFEQFQAFKESFIAILQ